MKDLSNRELGRMFEDEFCKRLSEYGLWVLNITQNRSGQPADVIATKNGKSFLIDCKVCTSWGFRLSRVEPNQLFSMTKWRETGNGEGWFALKITNAIFMLPFWRVEEAINANKSAFSVAEIPSLAIPFERWVSRFCE